jgi:hypothetical protein
VFCVGANDCWAVGDFHTIIQWNGASWETVLRPTSNELWSVFVDSGWAVGGSGTIIRGDPTTPLKLPAVSPVGGIMLPSTG